MEQSRRGLVKPRGNTDVLPHSALHFAEGYAAKRPLGALLRPAPRIANAVLPMIGIISSASWRRLVATEGCAHVRYRHKRQSIFKGFCRESLVMRASCHESVLLSCLHRLTAALQRHACNTGHHTQSRSGRWYCFHAHLPSLAHGRVFI